MQYSNILYIIIHIYTLYVYVFTNVYTYPHIQMAAVDAVETSARKQLAVYNVYD